MELGPLSLPDDDGDLGEAWELLADRVRAQRPDIVLEDEVNARAMEAIVRQLEGLPLALELAAARCRLFELDELARRLEAAGLAVLGRGSRSDSRYRTLREAVLWSWSLLEEIERELLAELSVLRGEFGVAEVEAISSLAPEEVLDVLQELRDKSLVVQRASATGTMRLALLEAVRQVAGEQLEKRGQREATWDRAARAFSARCDTLRAVLATQRGPQAHDMLADMSATLRALVLEGKDLEADVRAGCALGLGAVARSEGSQARWIAPFAALAEDEALSPSRRQALMLDVSGFHFELGRYDEARKWAERVTAQGDEAHRMRAAMVLARASVYLEDLEAAGRALDEAESCGVEALSAELALERGRMAHLVGDRASSQAHFERALSLARLHDDSRTEARALHNLGVFYGDVSDVERSQAMLHEAMDLHRHNRDQHLEAQAHNGLGVLYMRCGERSLAQTHFRSALDLFERAAMSVSMAMVAANLGMLALDQGDALAAKRYAAQALSESINHDRYVKGSALLLKGHAHWYEGELDESQASLEEAHTLLDEVQHVQLRICVLAAMVGLRAQRGEIALAQELLERARVGLEQGGDEVLEDILAVQALQVVVARYREGEVTAFAAVDAMREGIVTMRERYNRAEPLRYAQELLAMSMPQALSELLALERRDPEHRALVVAGSGLAFRAPEADWHDLSRSRALARCFEVLYSARRERPGEVVSVDELREAIWPGERMLEESAANRLYVSVSKLRKAGLGALLKRQDEGYLLDAEVELIS